MSRSNPFFTAVFMLALLTLTIVSCGSDDQQSSAEPQEEVRPTKVVIKIPEIVMSEYTTRAAMQVYSLRAVAEVYRKGAADPLVHQAVILTPTAVSNVYFFEIEGLEASDYDIYVWTDYSTDGGDLFYLTDNLRAIRFNDPEYKPQDSNLRRAYYGKTSVNIARGTQTHTEPVKARTPFARYRIEAMDIDKYEQMKAANGWPELEDLDVRVTYNSYVPTSFDILVGQPSDAEKGIRYTTKAMRTTEGKVVISDDFVFVTGTKSSVNVTIQMVNPVNEEVISSIDNLEVEYQEGHVTTVSGDFLTSSSLDGSIIDTRWDGEYNIEF